MLRNEGDLVNLGLEITKTSRGFEVRNSTKLFDSLQKLYGLENSQPTANPGGSSTVMELATVTPLDGHDHSNIGGKFHLHGTMETRHNREQARSETVDTRSQRLAQHLSSSPTTHDGSKKEWLNLLVVVTQIGLGTLQRAKVLRDITAVYKE